MAEEKSLIDEEMVGQYVRGEITLQELLNMSADDLQQLTRLGYTLFEQGQLDQARDIFEGLVEINPHIAYFYTVLGSIHFKKNNLEEAVKNYTKALELNPNDIDAYTNRGEIYLQQGKIEEALQDLTKAIELDPEKDVRRKSPVAMRAVTLAMAAKEALETALKEKT